MCFWCFDRYLFFSVHLDWKTKCDKPVDFQFACMSLQTLNPSIPEYRWIFVPDEMTFPPEILNSHGMEGQPGNDVSRKRLLLTWTQTVTIDERVLTCPMSVTFLHRSPLGLFQSSWNDKYQLLYLDCSFSLYGWFQTSTARDNQSSKLFYFSPC